MRVGLAQTAPRLGDLQFNLAVCLDHLELAKEQGCELVAFPECALSGYMFEDRDSAVASAIPLAGDQTAQLTERCRRLELHCVVGALLLCDDQLWNSALLIGPQGLIGRYDKTHIPPLGVDRFVMPGQGPYEVHETAIGRIGMQICYDWRFPEVTRTLALAGADVVVMPTASPVSSREMADFIPRTRALENAVFFVMASRVGTEGGASFLGHSQVVDPSGNRLVEADDQERFVVADVEMGEARRKDRAQSGGLYSLRILQDRRPDLYFS